MKPSFSSQSLKFWIKPVLTCALGLVLLFRPGSLTTAIAKAIGILLALVGCGKLVGVFFGSNKKFDFLTVAGSIILILLGFSVIKNPVGLESRLVRLIGILLVLQGIRSFVDGMAPHSSVTSTLSCAVGGILILMPVTVSRLMVMVCGIVVLLIGIGMVLDGLKSGGPSGDDDIIDAR